MGEPGLARAAGEYGAGPSSVRSAGSTNISKETYDETGLPGSVKIGVSSSPTTPKPCGLPGCIATPPNQTVPERRERLLDHVVVALRHAAAGDDHVGAHQLVAERVEERLRVVAARCRPGRRSRPPRRAAAASM